MNGLNLKCVVMPVHSKESCVRSSGAESPKLLTQHEVIAFLLLRQSMFLTKQSKCGHSPFARSYQLRNYCESIIVFVLRGIGFALKLILLMPFSFIVVCSRFNFQVEMSMSQATRESYGHVHNKSESQSQMKNKTDYVLGKYLEFRGYFQRTDNAQRILQEKEAALPSPSLSTWSVITGNCYSFATSNHLSYLEVRKTEKCIPQPTPKTKSLVTNSVSNVNRKQLLILPLIQQ